MLCIHYLWFIYKLEDIWKKKYFSMKHKNNVLICFQYVFNTSDTNWKWNTEVKYMFISDVYPFVSGYFSYLILLLTSVECGSLAVEFDLQEIIEKKLVFYVRYCCKLLHDMGTKCSGRRPPGHVPCMHKKRGRLNYKILHCDLFLQISLQHDGPIIDSLAAFFG